MPGTQARLAVIVVVAYVYGHLAASLPAPSDASVFWLGNLAAPFLAIPFLAGAWRFGRVLAMVAGLLAGVALVAGFYGFLFVGNVTNADLDLPVTLPARQVVIEAYRQWLANLVIGDPSGTPWLTIAALFGAACGALGRLWATGRAWAAAPIAAAFLLEPAVYVLRIGGIPLTSRYAIDPWNVTVWTLEVLVGVALIVLTARRWRGDGRSTLAGRPL